MSDIYIEIGNTLIKYNFIPMQTNNESTNAVSRIIIKNPNDLTVAKTIPETGWGTTPNTTQACL